MKPRLTSPPARALHDAVRRLEESGLDELSRFAPRERLLDALGAVADVVERGGRIPDELLRDADGQAAVRRVEHALFAEVVRRLSNGGPPADDSLPAVLEGFVRVRTQIDEGADPEAAAQAAGAAIQYANAELAHDIRSPLTSILFLAETMRRGQSGAVNELQQRQLGIIYSAALGLVSLANDMIGLAHPSDEPLERHSSPMSVRQLFESIVDLVRPLADERKLSLRMLLLVDDERIGHGATLSRILLNLTTNALKNTETGMVELMARPVSDDVVELSVRDTGRGLDAGTIEELSTPFRTRAGSGRASLDSYGLGLTISRRLARALGTELRFETGKDWGTRFYFELAMPRVRSPE